MKEKHKNGCNSLILDKRPLPISKAMCFQKVLKQRRVKMSHISLGNSVAGECQVDM